jgi:fibrillarin-like rRNA methylase
MMRDHHKSIEFEAILDDARTISIPEGVSKFLKSGGSVHVRLTARVLSSELKDRNVSEEEIDRISSIQLEPRDQVVKFLLSEGALMKSVGRKRMQR